MRFQPGQVLGCASICLLHSRLVGCVVLARELIEVVVEILDVLACRIGQCNRRVQQQAYERVNLHTGMLRCAPMCLRLRLSLRPRLGPMALRLTLDSAGALKNGLMLSVTTVHVPRVGFVAVATALGAAVGVLDLQRRMLNVEIRCQRPGHLASQGVVIGAISNHHVGSQ